jgi:hypothetical protein
MANDPTKLLGSLPPPGPQREPIYRMISGLMILDVVVGIGLIVYGQLVANSDSIAYAGLGLAVLGAVMYGVFRFLAARAGRQP